MIKALIYIRRGFRSSGDAARIMLLLVGMAMIAGGWRGGLIMTIIMAPGYLLGLHSTGKYLVECAHRRLTGSHRV